MARDRIGGVPQPTELQAEFIDWLLDPTREGSQSDWAKAHGVHPNVLSNWKKRDQTFLDAWERRAAELNVNPERIQKVINAIYTAATSGDIKAASLYLQYVEKFTPKLDLGDKATKLADMSDEELAEMYENVVALRARK